MALAFNGKGGGGGASPLELLGPFAIAFDTPGLLNPAGNGVLVGPLLPAGTLVLAAWINTTTPWSSTNLTEVDVILNTAGSALLSLLTSVQARLNAAESQVSVNDAAAIPVWIRSGTDQLAVAFYATALAAGAGNVYALTASI